MRRQGEVILQHETSGCYRILIAHGTGRSASECLSATTARRFEAPRRFGEECVAESGGAAARQVCLSLGIRVGKALVRVFDRVGQGPDAAAGA